MALVQLGVLNCVDVVGLSWPIKLVPSSSAYININFNPNGGTWSAPLVNNTNTLYYCVDGATVNDLSGLGWEISLNNGISVSRSGYIQEAPYWTGSGCSISSSSTPSRIIISNITSSTITISAKWKSNSGTQYGPCVAPTYVYMTSNGVNYSSNNNNPDCPLTVGVTNAIKWSGAAGGTNNSINGYGVTEDGSAFGGSTYTNQHVSSTATSGSFNTSYTSGGVGKKYKATVRTEGSAGASYYSGHSASYVNIVPVASVTSYTVTFNANSGSVSPTSKSGVYGGTMELPTPTRSGYKFLGWYYNHNATAANIINLGKSYKYSGQISMSFWTYMADYTANSTGNEKHIVSCEEASGYGFYQSNDGAYMVWEVRDGSSYKNVKKATSGVSAGYHFWNCIFTGSGKKIILYMDGSKVGETATSNTTINYNANTVTFSGCDPDSTYTAPATGNAWTGRVGNLIITNDAQIRDWESSFNTISVPNQNCTMYAQWSSRIPVCYDSNGGTIADSGGIHKYSDTAWFRLSGTTVQISTNQGSSWSNLTSSLYNPDGVLDLYNVGTFGLTRSHYYFGTATANDGTKAWRAGSTSGNILNQDSTSTSSTNAATWARIQGSEPTLLQQYNGSSTVRLYVNWVARTTYTVAYNANGGSSTPSSQTKYHGEALTLAAAISKTSTKTTTTTTYTTTFNATANGGASNSTKNNTKTETTT